MTISPEELETPGVDEDTPPVEADISLSETPKAKPSKRATPPRPVATVEPYAVVGADSTDRVLLSRAVPKALAVSRKSLTVHHLQRRLAELGHPEAFADLDGLWGDLTDYSVRAWQTAQGYEPTGALTHTQFTKLFDGDVNVTVVLDTVEL